MIRIVCDGAERQFSSLPITIGRDGDNDVVLDDTSVSRHHCRICRTADGIMVQDLNSRSGVFVNGARTPEELIQAGDTILVGLTSLSIEWDPAVEPAPRRKKISRRELELLQRENRRLKRLLVLTHAVASERDEDALLRRILDSAIELTGAERGYLFLVTLHGVDFRAARDAQGRDVERTQELISTSISREAIDSGRPVMTEDAGGDARFAGGRSVAFLKLRSVLCVPLKVPDGPVGAIYLENSDVTAQFNPPDIPLVTAFGDVHALIPS